MCLVCLVCGAIGPRGEDLDKARDKWNYNTVAQGDEELRKDIAPGHYI